MELHVRELHVMMTGEEEQRLSVLGESVTVVGAGDASKPFEIHIQRGVKGGGPPPHHHSWDEAFHVLEGTVRVTVDDREFIAEAGSVVHIPGQTVHSYENLSASATLLAVVSDTRGGELFAELDRQVKQMPDDLPKVIEIGERYGVEFV